MLIGLKCQNREGFSSRSADLILFFCSGFSWGMEWRRKEGRPRQKGLWGGARAAHSAAEPHSPGFYRNPFYKMQLTAAGRRGLSKILNSKAFCHRVSGRGPAGWGNRKKKKQKKGLVAWPPHPTATAGGGGTRNESLLYFKRKKREKKQALLFPRLNCALWSGTLEREHWARGAKSSPPAPGLSRLACHLLPLEEADRRPCRARDCGDNHLPLF